MEAVGEDLERQAALADLQALCHEYNSSRDLLQTKSSLLRYVTQKLELKDLSRSDQVEITRALLKRVFASARRTALSTRHSDEEQKRARQVAALGECLRFTNDKALQRRCREQGPGVYNMYLEKISDK